MSIAKKNSAEKIKVSKKQRLKKRSAKEIKYQLLAKGENKHVLRMPRIARISPIVVQPQAVIIAIKLEDIRIAIRVGFVKRAICYHYSFNSHS